MIPRIIKIFVTLGLFINVSIAMAADLDHYKVIVNPEKVSVGEAVDLTIEAVDKENNIITDYEGEVLIFSESDKKAEFPKAIEDSSYVFKKSDEGSVKFENAVKFTKEGKHDIHVYDLDDETESTFGVAEVEVTKSENNIKFDIEILTPTSGTTIGKKEINVSGKSQKNHQIKIIINNKDEVLTTTNRDGIFEKVIDNLEDGENSIQAIILDANGEEVGRSKKILVKFDSSLPIFHKLKLEPTGEIQTNSKISAILYATKGLEEVDIIINDSINSLKEDSEGIYKGEFMSPKKDGEYKIDVILKNELGTKVEKKGVETLKVIPEIESASEGEEEKPVVKKDKCPNGDYTGDVFDGKCGKKPTTHNAAIDLEIKNLKIIQLKTKSVLTWDKLDDAVKYEVYKKMIGNKLELIDTVKEPKFEIAITGDDVKYEYFAVKAIGEKEVDIKNQKVKKEITGDLSDAVKIQTGPKEIIIVLISLLLGFGVFIISRRKA